MRNLITKANCIPVLLCVGMSAQVLAAAENEFSTTSPKISGVLMLDYGLTDGINPDTCRVFQ